MIEIGLWIRTSEASGPTPTPDEIFLIKKDPAGHPTLSVLQSSLDAFSETTLDTVDKKKAKIRALYESLTGHPHPHPHATSRQLMWDFLEAAIKQLA